MTPNETPDPLDSPQLEGVADRLKSKFGSGDGLVTQDEVADAVRDAAEDLRDAPVQTFVPLITENKARNRLQDEIRARSESRHRGRVGTSSAPNSHR